ncbi:MAG: hypothetical protein IRZ33_03845 [Alicyclobacillaceae bacterium]|nr:hypothetical protein [Alicyclobacillaceae bacterium]
MCETRWKCIGWLQRRWLWSVPLLMLLAGCGAPDLAHMRPTVWKPAAAVYLVDHPDGWNAEDVRRRFAASGVVVQVEDVASSQLSDAVRRCLSNGFAGLVMVVSRQPSPGPVATLMDQHVGVRFEWVGPVPWTAGGRWNVRLAVPDSRLLSYVLGWVAGSLAAADGWETVGWLLPTADATGMPSDSEASRRGAPDADSSNAAPEYPDAASLRMVLAGLYAANPKVTLEAIAPVPSAAQGGTGADAAAVGPWPRVVVTTRRVTPSEAAYIRDHGVALVSLYPQAADVPVAAGPDVPGPASVYDDVKAFAGLRWRAGTALVEDVDVLWMPSAAVPAQVGAGAKQWLTALMANPALLDNAWTAVPATTQEAWLRVVGQAAVADTAGH